MQLITNQTHSQDGEEQGAKQTVVEMEEADGAFPFLHMVSAAYWVPSHETKPPAEVPAKGQKILLEFLPYDVQFEIGKQMRYQDILKMGSTNRYFRQIMDPRKLLSKDDIYDFVRCRDLREENRVKGLLACYKCIKMLPKDKFALSAQLSRVRTTRTCIDCAAAHGTLAHGSRFRNRKLTYYYCSNCKTYATESARCRTDKIKDWTDEKEVQEKLSQCTKKLPRTKARLEELPTHLLASVAKTLAYEDLLRLEGVSRTIKEKINRDWIPIHLRHRKVLSIWTREGALEHGEVRQYPCMGCFRYKDERKFTPTQIRLAAEHPDESHFFKCRSCLNKFVFEKGSHVSRTYHQRSVCKICGLLRKKGQTCGGCVEMYLREEIPRYLAFPPKLGSDIDYEEHLKGLDGIFDYDVLEALWGSKPGLVLFFSLPA